MLNERHAAAQAIAADLLPSEEEIDSALVRNARIQIAVVEGRRRHKVALTVGQEALEHLIQSTVSLAAARKSISLAHLAFRVDQRAVGLDAFSYGNLSDYPAPSGAADVEPAHRIAAVA
ncbi:MAG: hypothetical protein ACTHM8_03070 [Sphingomonas sp.]